MGLQNTSETRNLITYASSSAFVPRTVAIMGRLGYRMVDIDAFAAEKESGRPGDPDLLIVDERRVAEIAGFEAEKGPPVVMLTGRRGASCLDARVVGAVCKPAGLHDLYRLAQEIFEETPRSLPRVDTDLAVACEHDGVPFEGRLLSISENGGLLRTERKLPLGSCFQMRMMLPASGRLEVRAEAAYQLLPDLGVVFSGIAPRARVAIGEHVAQTLLG